MMYRITLAAALSLFAIPLGAQWLDWPTPGIPRSADGKPNLEAPAPRAADGKPDLSGMWHAQTNAYRFDVIQDLKDESIFRPAAEAVFLQRVKDLRRQDPVTNCLPSGPSEMLNSRYRLMQTPAMIGILYEDGMGRYRQIYTDGRALPEDPNPAWLGYSVGHWEGDTLVVQSIGFNGKAWMDQAGLPTSEALKTTERFHRTDFGHMDITTTIDDPVDYKKPWTVTQPTVLFPDTDLLEHVCNENNKDLEHLSGKNKP